MAYTEIQLSDRLLEKARADTDTVLKELDSQLNGLSEVEAASRLKQVGPNEIAREKRQSALMRQCVYRCQIGQSLRNKPTHSRVVR